MIIRITCIMLFFLSPLANQARSCSDVEIASDGGSLAQVVKGYCGGMCKHAVRAIGGGDCYRQEGQAKVHTCSAWYTCSGNSNSCGCDGLTNAQVAAALPGCELAGSPPVGYCTFYVRPF